MDKSAFDHLVAVLCDWGLDHDIPGEAVDRFADNAAELIFNDILVADVPEG